MERNCLTSRRCGGVSKHNSNLCPNLIEANKENQLLQEIPIHRPSDTWFGSSTIEGELCYASKTQGRLSLEEVPFRPHRATVPVLIVNKDETILSLERLNLPVGYLSLFSSPQGQLWTQDVTITREKGMDSGTFNIGEDPSSYIQDAALVFGPRNQTKKGVLTRTLSLLFA